MPNENVNKVVLGSETLIDISDTTASSSDVMDGEVFYDASGTRSVGTLSVFDLVYPVGSIYMSVNSTDPATLFGGTWERITGRFLLAATDNGSSGASQAAGNTGGAATVKLTATQSGIAAHSHGLNSHTHGMNHKHVLTSHVHGLNDHTHTLASHTHHLKGNGNHWMKMTLVGSQASGSASIVGYYADNESGAQVTGGPSTNTSGKASGNTEAYGGYTGNSITTGSSSSAGNTGRTSTDGASGSTAEHSGATAANAHENMPPYLSVYMWKRTA